MPDYRTLYVEEMLIGFYESLYAAADKNIPKYKQRKYFSKPWPNAECRKPWKEREKKHKKWKYS